MVIHKNDSFSKKATCAVLHILTNKDTLNVLFGTNNMK